MPALPARAAIGHRAPRLDARTRALLLKRLLAGAAVLSIAVAAPAQAARTRTFSGRLELFHADGKSGQSDTYSYELHTRRGRYYSLHFAHRARIPRPESWVRLRGVRHGQRIAVKRVIGVSAHSAAVLTQAKKLAVILVNFQDNTSQPYTPEQVRQIIWTDPDSVRAYYREASFGQLELGSKLNPNGDVYGPYTIPYNETSSTCPNRTWGEAAMTAAKNAGVDLSGYTNIMFLWPEAPCGWAGAALVGGMYSYLNGALGGSLENSSLDWGKFAIHELGHNFGLYHAHSLICRDAAGNIIAYNPDESDCQLEEYGDPYDAMGSGYHNQFNDYAKGVLGWWPANAVQTATATGTHFLQPQETLGGGLQVLRVVKQTYANGEHQYYYLEFRQPSSFDDWNAFSVEVTEGVTIRLAGEFSNATGTELLDMNPPVPPEGLNLQSNAPLMPGETYTDPTTGVAIATNSASVLGASVTVTFPGSTLSNTSPTVPITAPASDTTPPTAPSGLSVKALSASQTALSWSPSTDNVAVTGYDIFRNGALLTTLTGTHFADSNLTMATAYTYQVRARDGAGNVSAPTNLVKATTTATKATGALAGWVTGAASGLPLNGAKLTAALNGHSWSANTNASGFYLLSNLAPGTYGVSIAKSGYATQTTTLVVVANAATIDAVGL